MVDLQSNKTDFLKRGGKPPLFSLLSRVRRAVDRRPGPNSRPYNPICDFSPTSSSPIWRGKIPKLDNRYMQLTAIAGRQRTQRSVLPTGPTICDFFATSSDRYMRLIFPETS